jgi:RIO kinase 1
MKPPQRLISLIDEGMIDEVVRQLMSGKEAVVYVVRSGDEIRCAKVYKSVEHRGFRQAALYQEGRQVKNSRQARAMAKGTSYGKRAQEEAWQSVEVDTLYKLAAAGVSVPKPYGFYEGVVLMDLVTDAEGNAAPRLNDVVLTAEAAKRWHGFMIEQIVLMLGVGIIHGDLSEFNVLLSADGPVIIDLPQAVDAAGNNNAEVMLSRDVNNMRSYFGQFDESLLETKFAEELWSIYQQGKLDASTRLTGRFERARTKVNLNEVKQVIDFASEENEERKRRIAERD